LGRVDVVIHDVGVGVVGDVVEAAAQDPEVSEEVEALFELEIEGEVFGEALRTGQADELLLIVGYVEGESGAGFEGVGDFGVVNDGKFDERYVSPGKEAVGSVPGIGTRKLWAEQWIVEVEVESLIGLGVGAGVGAHQHIAFAEVVAEDEFDGFIAIVTGVFEDEGAVVAGGGVVDEAARAVLFEEFGFQVDGGRKFSFEAEAPVDEARLLQN